MMMMMTNDNYDKIIPCTDTDPLRRNASIIEAVSCKSCPALAASLGVVDKSLNIFRATASRSVLMALLTLLVIMMIMMVIVIVIVILMVIMMIMMIMMITMIMMIMMIMMMMMMIMIMMMIMMIMVW